MPRPDKNTRHERYPISVTVGKRLVKGTFTVVGGIVEVTGEDGKTHGTQQGNSPAVEIAERVLYQMYASFRNPSQDADEE